MDRQAGPSTRRKLAPPAPAPPGPPRRTLPIKVLQGAATQRTDTGKANFPRDTIFVTRKTKLGALIGHAKKLVLDEGYTHLTLYALSAAIPHALLLLHAVLDVLPFPSGPGGIWYEMVTDTVACVDQVDDMGSGEFPGLGAVEVSESTYETRNKSSLRIDIHIAPRSKRVHVQESKRNRKARPGCKKRRSMKNRSASGDQAAAPSEEDMMNG